MSARDLPTPEPGAPGWVRVRPALAGICGTDLNRLRGPARPSPLGAFQDEGLIVPGHEVVGVVEDARSTRWAREGHRVIVEPTLRCVHKGLPECRRCRVGEPHLCENRDRAGRLCSGAALGSSARTGGAWSEGFLVHEDMLLPADGMTDQRGVLAEPAATALHAALRWARRGDQVAVIGDDVQARLLVASLRRLHPDLDIAVLQPQPPAPRQQRERRTLQQQIAGEDEPVGAGFRSLGASHVRRGSSEELLLHVAARIGARAMRTSALPQLPVLDGGLDAVFDCRATRATMDLAVRLLRGGGTLVISAPAQAHELEWSLVWNRELSVLGSALFGREANGHRTFAVVREWLLDSAFPVDTLVTHRFPLDEYDVALRTASGGSAAGAVKVVFEGALSTLRPESDQHAADADFDEQPILLHATAARHRARVN